VEGDEVCPECGRSVQPAWKICPFCEEPLARRPVQRKKILDTEVRRDTGAVGSGLVVLGLLGALGIIFFLCGGGGNLQAEQGRAFGRVGMILCVLLFVGVIAGISLAAQGKQVGLRVGSGVLGGLAIAFLALAFIVSWLVVTFASCNCMNFR
jgi:hypothetical protein